MLSRRYLLLCVAFVLLMFSVCFFMCKRLGCEKVRFIPKLAEYIHETESTLLELDGQSQKFEVKVISFPEYKNGYIRCVGQLSLIGAKVDMFIEKENGENPVDDFGCGDLIEIDAEISVPEHPGNAEEFDYREYQIARGVSGNLYAKIEDLHVVAENNNVFYGLKNKMIAQINCNFDSEAAGVISSMMIGFKGDLDDGIKDNLSNAGLSHVIAISGIHFSCMIMFVLRMTGKSRRKYRRKNIIMLGVVLTYVVLVGTSSSVVRAAFMIGGRMLALILKREQDNLTTLSLSALVELTLNPLVFLTLSFQLSYLSFLGVIYVAPIVERITYICLQRIGIISVSGFEDKKTVLQLTIQSITSSVGASIIILPFLVNSFGRIAALSVLLNVIAVPISEMILILGAIWLALSPVLSPVNGVFTLLISALVQGLIWIAKVGAESSINNLLVSKMNIIQIISYYLLVLLSIYCVKRPVLFCILQIKKHLLKFSAITLLWIFGISCLIPHFTPKAPVKLTAFDVGQGDCTLLEFDDGKKLLIDAGEGKINVEELLLKNGINFLDAVVATHMHSDHIGGFADFESVEVERLLVPYGTNMENMSKALLANTGEVHGVAEGQKYMLGEIEIWIINPDVEVRGVSAVSADGAKSEESADENNRSIVALVKYKDVEVLLCGDAEEEAEKNIVEEYGEAIDCDIIKVGHHGSDTSSSAVFIQAAQPEFGVVSVGEDNRYGHPSEEVLERYDVAGTALYRTDQCGSVRLSLYGDRVITHFHKEYVCR